MTITPSMRRILSALDRDGDMEADEIAIAANVAESTLSGGGYLTKLLAMDMIRVSRWIRADKSGPPRPVYSVSPGKSATKPKPFTNAEKAKRWKRRAGYYKPEYAARRTAKQSMDAIINQQRSSN